MLDGPLPGIPPLVPALRAAAAPVGPCGWGGKGSLRPLRRPPASAGRDGRRGFVRRRGPKFPAEGEGPTAPGDPETAGCPTRSRRESERCRRPSRRDRSGAVGTARPLAARLRPGRRNRSRDREDDRAASAPLRVAATELLRAGGKSPRSRSALAGVGTQDRCSMRGHRLADPAGRRRSHHGVHGGGVRGQPANSGRYRSSCRSVGENPSANGTALTGIPGGAYNRRFRPFRFREERHAHASRR